MTNDDIKITRLGQYAGFVSRLIAWLVDQLILVIIWGLVGIIGTFVVDQLAPDNEIYYRIMQIVIGILNVIIYWSYFIGGWMLAGQTPGKSMMGLRVVRTDGERLKFRNALIRLLGYWVSTLIFFMGYWWVIFDKSRQGWHDHLARTYVVYSETWAERAQQRRVLQDHHRTKQKKLTQQNTGQ